MCRKQSVLGEIFTYHNQNVFFTVLANKCHTVLLVHSHTFASNSEIILDSYAQRIHLSAVLKSLGGTVLSGMLLLAVILEVDDIQEHVDIF